MKDIHMQAIRRLLQRYPTFVSVGLLLMHDHANAQAPKQIDRGYMHIESGGVPGEAKETQLARALTAGPRTVVGEARVIGVDSEGKTIVLREGANGFVCQPGNPRVAGRPASCSNAAALQWSADLTAGKASPTNQQAGFIYMLAGASERDASGSTRTIGPQWMIVWPFDPQATGFSAIPKDTGAYIRWAGTPYAHLNIMGQPLGPRSPIWPLNTLVI